jgi:hypothetical protein
MVCDVRVDDTVDGPVLASPGCYQSACCLDSICLLPGLDRLCPLPGLDLLCPLPGLDLLYALPGLDMLCPLPGLDRVNRRVTRQSPLVLPYTLLLESLG